mmetsp:Transcript_31908/g.92696  ORF Transcript_31908/g.92696 Transcript_31908/m.92696 type:complete len:264 (-) Transcript_31908:397-1188(-)
MMWYSSLMPLPPSMSLAVRAMSRALPQEFRFTREIISGACWPWSMSRPTWRLPWRPREISVAMSANFFWMSWFDARGAPNCCRSRVYWVAVSRQNLAAPMAPQEMPKRALFRQEKGPPNPRASGSWFSAGTGTSSMKIIPVAEARRENFPSILGAERPAKSFSKMNPRITPSSSLAQTTKTSAMGELVIQFLEPLSTQLPSAWRRARVSIDPGSEPWLGSVRPKQPTSRPAANSGRNLAFCSSEPKVLMGCITKELCTDMALR